MYLQKHRIISTKKPTNGSAWVSIPMHRQLNAEFGGLKMPTDNKYADLLKKYNRLKKRQQEDKELIDALINFNEEQRDEITSLKHRLAFYQNPLIERLEKSETLN